MILILQALGGVIMSAGQRMGDKHKIEIKDTLLALQSTAHEGNRLQAAQCLGAMTPCISDDQLTALLKVRWNLHVEDNVTSIKDTGTNKRA